MGIYYDWRRGRKNKRQSTLKDFHDDMRRFNNRHAFATITPPMTRAKIRRARHYRAAVSLERGDQGSAFGQRRLAAAASWSAWRIGNRGGH
jgi:hypothetical protein